METTVQDCPWKSSSNTLLYVICVIFLFYTMHVPIYDSQTLSFEVYF